MARVVEDILELEGVVDLAETGYVWGITSTLVAVTVHGSKHFPQTGWGEQVKQTPWSPVTTMSPVWQVLLVVKAEQDQQELTSSPGL